MRGNNKLPLSLFSCIDSTTTTRAGGDPVLQKLVNQSGDKNGKTR